MQLLDGFSQRGFSSANNSPRNISPRNTTSGNNSPRCNSPRSTSPRHSPRSEDSLTHFAKAKLPGTLHLVQKGQESSYFKLVEKTFQLLNDLQFHCLPLKYRSLGTKHYIATEAEKRREEMETLYSSWLDKEQQYIEEQVGPLDALASEQQELIGRIRQAIFTTIYEEQNERKKQDPFQPFLSICNIEGKKNASYHASLMQAKMQQQAEKPQQEKVKKNQVLFDDFLQKKGISPAKLAPEEKKLVLAAKIATMEARLKASYDEPQSGLSEDISLQFELLAANMRGSGFSSALSNWEELRFQHEALLAKQLADKKWADYSKRESAVFEELHGFAPETLSAQEKALYDKVRTALYRVIYEEQSEGLPFCSIYSKEGELNEEYWIDRLDAQAKKNKETPLEDPHPLKHYTDYDVLRTNTAPPKTKADGITDDSRLRTPGAITPDFCSAVLGSIKQYARLLKQKVVPENALQNEPETNKALFNSSALSTEEKILFFLNEYCEALAHTHYIRGLTQGMLTKMNIKVQLGQPSLSGIVPRDLRKSRKSDADKTPGLLRKISGALASPSLLRRSPIPEAEKQPLTPTSAQSVQSEPDFEKECRLFQEDLKIARKYVKLTTDERIQGCDDAVEYFRIYAISLQIMANELKTLSQMLQAFATSLQAELAARLERHSRRYTGQNHRNSSLGIRPHRRPTLSEGTFEPPLRARSVSLMSQNRSMPVPLALAIPASVDVSSESSLNTSPPESPRIADMNPEKFTEKAALLMQLHTLFMEAHEVISTEVEKATPETPETCITKNLEKLTLQTAK